MARFISDKKRGEAGELLVRGLFESAGYVCTTAPPKTPGWDLLCVKGDKSLSCEVKNDEMAVKTGNIAIEVANSRSGKDSGLSVTTADLWVTIVGEEMFVIHTETLRDFVRLNLPFRNLSGVGDGNAQIMLYKKTELDKVWVKLGDFLSV